MRIPYRLMLFILSPIIGGQGASSLCQSTRGGWTGAKGVLYNGGMSLDLLADDADDLEGGENEVVAAQTPVPVLDAPLAPPPVPPAQSVRVMHFADVHLGVETYGRYNPETGLNTRLEDFTRALNEAVDLALKAEADIAVFAGDAYKVRDPNQTHQRAFAGALKRLTDADVPVVMLVGNHDMPNTRGRAHALEIYGLLGSAQAHVTLFAAPDVQPIVTRRGTVLVAGMPYLTRSRVLQNDEAKHKTVEDVAHLIRDKYTDYIARMGARCASLPDYIAILMGHFTVADARVGVQSFLVNPNEPQVPVSAVTAGEPSPFDYVAMGHVHRPQDMNKGNQPPVVYSGSIDRIDFGERKENKGFVVADVCKGHTDFEWVTLGTRPFLAIEIDASESEDPTTAIIEAIARHKIEGAIVKVNYKVPPDRAALVRTDEVRKALSAAHLVVAVSRDMPAAEALIRSQVLTEALTPEKALATYLDLQPRLAARRDELVLAARPLFDLLAAEEAMR